MRSFILVCYVRVISTHVESVTYLYPTVVLFEQLLIVHFCIIQLLYIYIYIYISHNQII